MDNIFKKIAAKWYDRPGTLRECTEQVLNFLVKLKAHNPVAFGAWYEPAKSKKQALERKVEFTYEGIRKVITRDGIKKGDLYIQATDGTLHKQEEPVNTTFKRYNDEVYTKLAYHVVIWNGLDGLEGSDISMSIGSPYGNRYWSNNCIIDLPKAGVTHDYYQIRENQQALIELLKDCWKPDYIEVNGEQI